MTFQSKAPWTTTPPERAALALTLVLLVGRLLLIPYFDLVFDEAYYRIWSQTLRAGYYDHPPMVAFFIRAGTELFGDGPMGIRFFGTLSVALDALLIYLITRTLTGDRRLAAWSAIFFNVTLLTAGAILITPDQPLCLFWLITFYGLARLARNAHPAWWLWVGVAAGLTVVSKYTGFFLGLAIVWWILVVPDMRRAWRSPWLYGGGAIAFLIFLPVLLWNIEAGGASLKMQFGRIEATEFNPLRLFDYLGAYIGLLTPVLIIPSLAGLWWSLRSGAWRRDPAIGLVVAMFAPLALYFAVHALRQPIHANWVAPLVLSGVIFAALAFSVPLTGWAERANRWSLRHAAPAGLALMALAYSLALLPTLPLDPATDPLGRFKGWRAFAVEVDDYRRRTGATALMASNYGPVSLLRYLVDPVPVIQFGEPERWRHFPAAARGLAEGPALYVALSGETGEMSLLQTSFDSVIPAGSLSRMVNNVAINYPLFLVSGLKDLAGVAAPEEQD